ARHAVAVLVDEMQQTGDRHLAEGLKERMVDRLTARRILQRPVRSSPLAPELEGRVLANGSAN
ncbi:MAG TPA: hypothetical protein VLA19_15725, partial [Herpetosiphonaceae bacterium]|nr:hypothetical protein [Herpetosiphonaceae bacterium]